VVQRSWHCMLPNLYSHPFCIPLIAAVDNFRHGGARVMSHNLCHCMLPDLYSHPFCIPLIAAVDNLPGGIEGANVAKALVVLFFLVTSIKSR